jgi:microcompartment protein CcmL/EutN
LTKWNDGDAMGFVETLGLTAAIEAADAMGKAARVRVKTVLNADAGLISVVCEGDLGACRAAVDAGAAAATRLGHFLCSNIIARPFPDTGELVALRARPLYAPPAPAKPVAPAGKQAGPTKAAKARRKGGKG